MPNITKEKISAMATAFDMAFKDAFKAETDKTISTKFAMPVGDADHMIVEIPFFEAFSFMRKWVGPRQVKNLSSKKLVLKEDAFEDTFGVTVREIETDSWGFYSSAVKQLAENAVRLWDRLATEALTDAGNWIDGKAFFATDRKYGKNTISNKTTSALSASTFNTAYETMASYVDHAGEPLGVVPDLLMVGPKNRTTAFEILNSKLVASGNATIENANYGIAEVLVNPYLVGTADDYWFLMSTKSTIKPVALQKRKEGELSAQNQPTDDCVFSEGKALYGTSAYGSAAAAFPHLVYGGIL